MIHEVLTLIHHKVRGRVAGGGMVPDPTNIHGLTQVFQKYMIYKVLTLFSQRDSGVVFVGRGGVVIGIP